MSTDKATDKEKTVVKSADRVLDIIELLASDVEPMSLTDISRVLDMPASSTYKLLQNLLNRGYLETDRQEKQFRLGYKILEIGTKYTQNTSLISEFQHVAQRIVDEINEAVYLSIRSENNIMYIAEKQSTQPVRFVSHLGMKLPLHATAMGKMMLSRLNEEELNRIYPDDQLGTLTETTLNNRNDLNAQLASIREEGLAYSNSEAVQGVQCVAAPIINSQNQMVAAMSISIPKARMSEELWEKAGAMIRQAAKELGLKIYYQQV
ncbi:IclR family transcriptional regulator [Cohnella sp. GCM10020058]|uniref:IclR family transcriptional regulator n=1 Tax=Cohnella sp. GCM10020058 TaxID=3317330 RepID=UPI0036253698